MFSIDTSTEFGARVDKRLRTDTIAWLTTVDAKGTPQPLPVWFLWDGTEMLIYSQPNTAKIRHIEGSPRVSLNLDGNGRGGAIVVLTGAARIVPDEPPADANPAYVTKYEADIPRIGMTPATFAASYSVPIRITPERLRGH